MVFDADGYPDIEYLHSLHCTELPAAGRPISVNSGLEFRLCVVSRFQDWCGDRGIFLGAHWQDSWRLPGAF